MGQGTLKINSENILPIIKKWLYSDKDIFLRELISNATDAIQKLQILSAHEGLEIDEKSFQIDIKLDKEAKTLTISDTGLGMSAEEIEKYITEVAFSGAQEFIDHYKDHEKSEQIIGHFGLGFYSAFMVSSDVEIHSKSYKEDAKAAHWKCDGSTSYDLEEGTRENRGTDIILHINDPEYLEEAKLKSILSTYCSFLPFPIFLGTEQINKDEPLWLKMPSECTDEEYLAFHRKLYPTEVDPIFWLHLNVDHPFHLKGILYFPKVTPRFDFQKSNIKLFSNRVYVSDNLKELFPDFLTVLRGAIDSSDIPLNVSRSYLQMDSTVKKLGSHITKKIADRLTSLYNLEKEKFEEFWPDMETIIKLGILHDEKFYDRIKNLIIWKNLDNSWTTVEAYQERHKEEYKGKVFYTTHESEESGFLSMYKEGGVEVLYGGGPLDNALFNFLESKLGARFQRTDGGIDDVIIDKDRERTLLNSEGKSESSEIAEFFKKNLGEDALEIEAKSLTTDNIPGFVMIDEQTRRMRDYLTMTQKELPHGIFGKHTFIVNTNSPLVHALLALKNKEPELTKELTRHIYDLSLLAQKELHPEKITSFAQATNSILAKLTVLANKE